MGRTNVVVDEELISRVMRLYGLRTKRAAIDLALRRAAADAPHQAMHDLRGSGWAGDLDELRRDRPPSSG